jgi:hypothetical protein
MQNKEVQTWEHNVSPHADSLGPHGAHARLQAPNS